LRKGLFQKEGYLDTKKTNEDVKKKVGKERWGKIDRERRGAYNSVKPAVEVSGNTWQGDHTEERVERKGLCWEKRERKNW